MDFLVQNVSQTSFWIAVLQIIGVNVVLSGDNAVVIALTCMTLPPRQRLWGMILGAAVAILLRILFTAVVAQAINYPYLRLIGGLLLFWVAIRLMDEDGYNVEERVRPAQTLWRAIRIVAVADIVMSIDNVIAIAASAETAAASVDLVHAETMKVTLIVFGLATSIPLIVAGSALLLALLERYRILVWAGGALLGWIAGDIMATDPALAAFVGMAASHWHAWAGRAGALIVIGIGLFRVSRHRRFTMEDVLAGIGVILWIAAGVGIGYFIAPEAAMLRWLTRGAVVLVLAAGYRALRSGRTLGPDEV